MAKSNDIEIEIDAIRDKIYETIHKMSIQERVEYINSRAREALREQRQKNRDANSRVPNN
jgi:hypothetical protein